MFTDNMITFCIAGHCNTKQKVNQAVELINAIKGKYPNEIISYCSHYPVDPKIQELTNYSFYDSNNIISNVDYADKLSKIYHQTFWHIPYNGYHLVKSIPHQCFAHHLNWYTQSTVMQNNKSQVFFFINTDCEHTIFEQFDKHIEYHCNRHFDALFYNFFVGDKEINGEFFSMSLKGVQKLILSMKTFSDFYSYGTWSFEQCYFRASKFLRLKTQMFGVWPHNNGIIGTSLFSHGQTDENIEMLNATHEQVYVIPYIDYLNDNKLRMTCMVSNQPEDFKGCIIRIKYFNDNYDVSAKNDECFLSNNQYYVVEPPNLFPIVKVYRNEEFCFSFDLRDKRNIGDLVNDNEINDYNKNLKG